MSFLGRLIASRVNPRPAAIARIAIGFAAAMKALAVAPVLGRFDDPSVLRVAYLDWLPSVTDVPSGLVIGAWIVFALAFAAGLATTLTGALLTLTLAAVLFGDQQLYSNHLYLLTLLVALLTLGRSGSAISLDAARGAGRGRVAGWPLWLIKVQISIVYLFAGLSKINGAFLSGTVVAVTLRREGPLAIPLGWRTFEPMAVLSILAIAAEVFLAIGLWLPRWRRLAFVLGLGLHAGIAIWFIPTAELLVFGVIILSPYILFLDVPERGAVVVWDDSCGFCAGWVRSFRRLDWLHALRFMPSSDAATLASLGIPRVDADRALQLVVNGRREQGFAAVVGVLERMPVSFLWAPILRLPPIAWMGHRAYRSVAVRRTCAIGAARP